MKKKKISLTVVQFLLFGEEIEKAKGKAKKETF